MKGCTSRHRIPVTIRRASWVVRLSLLATVLRLANPSITHARPPAPPFVPCFARCAFIGSLLIGVPSPCCTAAIRGEARTVTLGTCVSVLLPSEEVGRQPAGRPVDRIRGGQRGRHTQQHAARGSTEITEVGESVLRIHMTVAAAITVRSPL
jgi:hypothetical protein